MPIGYLFSSFPKASETFVYREVLGLLEMGLSIEIIAIERPDHSELSKLPPQALALVDRVHYVGRLATGLGLARTLLRSPARSLNTRFEHEVRRPSVRSVRLARAHAVARLVERLGISKLHAHWPYASQLAALVHDIAGVPISISVHAHEVAHEGGHFPALFERIDFAAFCNQAAMNYLLERLPGRCQALAHLIYHGVDLEAFRPVPLPENSGPLRVVSAGRMTRTKGFDRLVRGVARARAKDIDVSLTICGDGPCRGEIERLASEQGIAEAIQLTGWVKPDQVREHLARSHVFALLADTSYHDGLPNVVLEAMAIGRPVILSPLPAAEEALSPGVNGFVLSDVEATEELVGALAALSENPSRAAEMGAAAREMIERRFEAGAHLASMGALLSS